MKEKYVIAFIKFEVEFGIYSNFEKHYSIENV